MRLIFILAGFALAAAGCSPARDGVSDAGATEAVQVALWAGHAGSMAADGIPVTARRIYSEAGKFRVELVDDVVDKKPACQYVLTGVVKGDEVQFDPSIQRHCHGLSAEVAGYVVPRVASAAAKSCLGDKQRLRSCYVGMEYADRALSLKITKSMRHS